ncbi:hypothetical protein B0I35DRAFT_509948 [Stachybotrys elegans]|uniref:Uncharacterized protein n=1 Tax=Stachybotrys elegans TaxID=80388 RepID=A0A8K0SVZ6_9HYPO|nr:hypothetical protein B0I35DRAFT_509948 [Stachybotrys elegans]
MRRALFAIVLPWASAVPGADVKRAETCTRDDLCGNDGDEYIESAAVDRSGGGGCEFDKYYERACAVDHRHGDSSLADESRDGCELDDSGGFIVYTNITATPTSIPSSAPPVVDFTRVSQTAHIAEETCYALPPDAEGEPTRRALLYNSKLREADATIPYPYIESIDFDSEGLEPLYMTIRDVNEGTHMIDVSNKSRIAIVDVDGNAMVLDPTGIHFSTKDCRYDVSVMIDDLYEQLAGFSGKECSTGGFRLMEDVDFRQSLILTDQCGDPVTRAVRRFPRLTLGPTECVENTVDESTGRWDFDCTFPGSDSKVLTCQRTVTNDIVNFLFRDPFGGACPDLPALITTLAAVGESYFDAESLLTELDNQGLTPGEGREAQEAVDSYVGLWLILQQAFSVIESQQQQQQRGRQLSALEEYVAVYSENRNLESDVCENMHHDEMPLKLSLTAGVTHIDTITTLNWSPQNARVYNVTIQDPAAVACCAAGAVATSEEGDTCAYPEEALVGDTGCICGLTAAGDPVAFVFTQCDNFVGECEADADCGDAGLVCLTGTCCGGGVCVDPYECSQSGRELVEQD